MINFIKKIDISNNAVIGDLKNLKFFQKQKTKKEETIINPNTYWIILVITTFIVILISLYFNIILLQKISKELEEQVVINHDTIKTKIITKDKIQKALEYFSSREKKSTEILNSPSEITDPSL